MFGCKTTRRLALAGICLLAGWGTAAEGVELQLRKQVQLSSSIVLLGDVADIYTSNTELQRRLATVELFPAPVGSSVRYLGLRELQDLLIRNRVNLSELTFSGASQVAISQAAAAPQPKVTATPELPDFKKRRANDLAVEAIRKHLILATGKSLPYEIKLELNEAQLRSLGSVGTEATARGGEAPFVGHGRYLLTIKTADGESELPVDADVSLPPAVVVATRPILKGTALRATDLDLQPVTGALRSDDVFYSLDEVLDQEAIQSIAAGQPVVARMLRKPVLVRRGDPVTVFSRSAGVVVKTTARARDDGSHGDVVSVESLTDRSTYYARVCGVQQVEVFARATVAESPAPNAPSQPMHSLRSIR